MVMSSGFVPKSETEITAVWLERALSASFPAITINSIDAERIGEAYGLASRIFRYRIAGSHSPESVVIKLWNTDSNAGMREAYFYQIFGGEAGARIPASYYAAVDPAQKRGVLILEEIRPFVQGDCLQDLSLSRAQLLAQNLAALHAQWMGNAGLQQEDWLRSLLPWEPAPGWFVSRRALFLERFSTRLNDRARALLDQIEQAPNVVNRRLVDVPVTLLHAELHLDNVVFEGDAGPVILDWAKCARGPAAFDIYPLLFAISRPQDMESVLHSYLNAFALYGEAPDRTALQHQLAAVFLYKFVEATCGVARWQPATPRESAMIDVSIRRTLRALDFWHANDDELMTFVS